MSNDPPNESLRINTAIAPLPPNEKERLECLDLLANCASELDQILLETNQKAERLELKAS